VLERSNYADNADRISYRQALLEHAKVDPTTADRETLARAAGADARLAATLGDKRDDWLNLILSQKVLPGFASDRLTVLYHYPASQAALARINPTDESVADRFEIFLGDLELANGYVELTDANEQRQRFESDQMERRKRGIEERPLDPRLIAALGSGLPDCSGVAVGFDRLQLIYENATDIASVRSFPFEGRVK
jgi:lysyl-tRNA synthetase class 2